MLKKELCKRCRGLAMWGWSTNDDLDWKDGWLVCPIEYTEKGENRIRKTTDKPPTNCPYYLEHTV